MRPVTRKWKLVLLAFAVTAVSALFLGIYLWTNYSVDQYVQTLVTRFVQSHYPVRIEIDSTQFDLTGRRFVLRGLRIHSEQFPSSPAPVSVEEIEIHFYYRIWNRLFRIQNISIRGPKIRIEEDSNHLLNITNMFQPRVMDGKGQGFSLSSIGNISIEGGTVTFLNESVPMDVLAGGLRAALSPQADGSYRISVGASRLELGRQAPPLEDLSLQANFRLEKETIYAVGTRLQSSFGNLDSDRLSLNYHTLQYDLQLRSRLDLDGIPYPPLKKANLIGTLDLTGELRGAGKAFDFAGSMAMEKLQYRQYALSGVSASARVSPERIQLDELRGQWLGGRFRTKFELGLARGSTSQISGQISQAGIDAILDLFAIPVDNITGKVDSEFQLHWTDLRIDSAAGSFSADYAGQVIASASARRALPGPAPEPIAYSGSATVRQSGRTLDIERAAAATARSRLEYAGTLTLGGDYDLKLRVQSQNGGELLHGAALFSGPAGQQIRQREIRMNAPLDFDGSIAGHKSDFRLTGRLHAAAGEVKQVQLLDPEATVEWTPRLLQLTRASLRFHNSRITGSLRYPLEPGKEPVRVEATIRNAPIRDLLALGNWRYPVDGILTADVRAAGPGLDSIEGTAQATVESLTVKGETFSRLTGAVRMRGREFDLRDLRASKGGGLISGTVSGRTDSPTLKVDLKGRGIPLRSIQSIDSGKLPLDGILGFAVQGNGAIDNMDHTLQAELSNVTLRGERLQNIAVNAKARGQRIDFNADTTLQANRVEAQGNVLITGDYPFETSMELHSAAIRPYVLLLRPGYDRNLRGLATGRVEARGALRRMENTQVEARFSTLQLTVDRYQLRNQGEVRLAYLRGVVDIKPVRMIGPETSLQFSGQISTTADQPINLAVTGNADLLALAGLVPDLQASGKVDLNIYATGTVGQPRILGSASLQKASLNRPDWPTSLFDVTGQFRFTANQVSVQSLTARTRYGTLRAEGGLFLDGLAFTRGRLNITGEGLRIDFPRDFKSTVDVDLDFLKSGTNQLVTGVLYVRDAAYVQEETLADLIAEFSGYRALPSARPIGSQAVNLDLDVEAYKTIRINNNLADVVGSGVFNVRGTLDDPVILGRLSVDQGKLILQDSKYEITRGAINFNNPRKIAPNLDFEAETNVRDYTVTINLRGPLDHLTTVFRSDPPLTTSDIVSMLAVGRPLQEVSTGNRDQEQRSQTLAFHGASTFLSRSLTEKLTSRSTRLFGFDRFTIDPFIFTGANPGARVTLGKQISKDVSLIFATDLASTQSEVVTVEYTIREGITLVATRNETGAFGLDVKLRKRF